jgi:hypothetical protein
MMKIFLPVSLSLLLWVCIGYIVYSVLVTI